MVDFYACDRSVPDDSSWRVAVAGTSPVLMPEILPPEFSWLSRTSEPELAPVLNSSPPSVTKRIELPKIKDCYQFAQPQPYQRRVLVGDRPA